MSDSIVSKVLKGTGNVLGWAAIADWVIACGYVTSWSGHRPLLPDRSSGRIYAFNNHGIMYVSAQDLFWWNAGIYLFIGLGVIAAVSCYTAKYFKTRNPR
jgi:hypothetical protein